MRYTIRSDEPMDLTLCENDTEKSVIQNTYLILMTVRNSIPMYRDFGLTRAYKDRPMTAIEPLITSEVTNALRKFEPRVSLVEVEYEYDATKMGEPTVILEVELK